MILNNRPLQNSTRFIIGELASGLFGLGSSAYQGYQNMRLQHDAQRYNTSEREASQDFQNEQRLAQQAYQTSEREAQNQAALDYYNQTSSPQAMVKQLKDAGLNPLLANQGQGSSAISSGSSGGAPTSGAPSGTHISPPYQNMSVISDSIAKAISGLSTIASAKKDLADAKKTGIETEKVGAVMDAQADALSAQASSAMAQAALNNVIADIKQRYGDREMDAQIKQFLANASMLTWNEEQAKQNIRNLKVEESYKKKLLDYFDTDKQFEYGESQSRIDVNTSQSVLNYSARDLNHAQNKLVESTKLNMDEVQRLSKVSADLAEATSESERNKIIEQNDYLRNTFVSQLGILQAELEKAQFENNTKYANFLKNLINPLVVFQAK